jgi:hypothetical protein
MADSKGFYGITNLAKRLMGSGDEPEAEDNATEERTETRPRRGADQGPNEADKAYELRKAIEGTPGGDTRRDRTRM